MKKISFIIIPFLLWISVVIYQGCSEPRKETSIGLESAQLKIQPKYLGNEACRSCHAREFNEWSQSHHAKAMTEASDSTVLGDFSDVDFVSKDVKSRFYRKGSMFMVQTVGPDGKIGDFEITYTFGWEPLQQYLVKFPDGRLQALHLAWDSDQNRWFDLYPDESFEPWDWMHWTKGAMTWNAMCADCHSTNIKKKYQVSDNTYQTSWSVINVGCESCHGPGELHVKQVETAEYVQDMHLVQLKNNPSVIQVENCAPCHSRRTAIASEAVIGERLLDHYIPDLLSENLYHPDGQINEEVYVYGSFVQSKMYQNGVKCGDCHNPHSGELLLAGNALCVNCHTSKYDRPDHHLHAVNTEASQCVNCHMPGKTYMINDFRRDHSFRVPRPDLSIRFGTPNACNSCHTDETATWAADAIQKWYGEERVFHYSEILAHQGNPEFEDETIQLVRDATQPAIVRATAINYLAGINSDNAYQTIVAMLADREGMIRIASINALVYLPLEDRVRLIAASLDDPVRGVRITAGNALADAKSTQIPIVRQDSWVIAVEEYRHSLKQNEDFPVGQFQIGQFRDRRGEDPQAILAYLKSLQFDSLLNGPRINLARLYSKQGQNEKAIIQLENAAIVEPNNPDVAYSLGLVYAEEGRYDEASTQFEKAALTQYTNPRIYYNWGLVVQQLGDYEKAAGIFQSGLSQIPEADDIRYALSTLYVEMGRYQDALKEVNALIRKYPNDGNLQNLEASIKQRMDAKVP